MTKPNIGIDGIKFGITREEVREIVKGYEYEEYKEKDQYRDIHVSFTFNEENKLYQLGFSHLKTFVKEEQDKYFVFKYDLEDRIRKFDLVEDELMEVWFNPKSGIIFYIYDDRISGLIFCTEQWIKEEGYI